MFEAVRHAVIATGNPNLLPALILLGAAAVPVSFVAFMFARPSGYDVGAGPVVLVAVVGGVIGVVTAGLVEYDTLHRLGVLPLLAVAVIEEAAKLIAPLIVVLFTRYRRPADGLLFGVAAGAGFAALETMGYAFVVLIQSQGQLATVDGVLLLRGLLSPAAHMTWTGLAAAALWRGAEHRWHPGAVWRFSGVFGVAVLLHSAWDRIGLLVGYIVLAAISLTLLTLTAHRLATPDTTAPCTSTITS